MEDVQSVYLLIFLHKFYNVYIFTRMGILITIALIHIIKKNSHPSGLLRMGHEGPGKLFEPFVPQIQDT